MRVSVFPVGLGFLLVLALATVSRADTAPENGPPVWSGMKIRVVEFAPSPATDGLTGGLRIDLILPGHPGSAAGLRPDDVILYVNGKPTPDVKAYLAAIRDVAAGTVVPVVFIRGHERLTANVRFETRPADYEKFWSEFYRRCLGGGPQAVAAAARAGDYQKAFREDLIVFRCANAKRGAEGASAWDKALVEIVRILPKLKPVPAVPSEAERHNQRAVMMLKNAANDADIDQAANEFGYAVYEAPWLPDLYLNRALTLEKAGYPEWAIPNFRDYLLLKPNGGDAGQVKQKIAELEVLVEERKPWLPFTGTFTNSDGSSEVVSLRGRKLVIRVAPKAGDYQNTTAGDDVFLSATIHGNRLDGQAFVHPNVLTAEPFSRRDPAGWIRCFGPTVMALDAEGEIEPGGAHFRVRVKEPSYNPQSCVIARHDWALEVIQTARVSQ